MADDPTHLRRPIPWGRLVGEFVVIVTGVLVALAADSWNDRRLERVEEREYLERLFASVARDTTNYVSILSWIDQKEAGLARLDSVLSSSAASYDADQLLVDLTAAPNYGWNVGPIAAEATFEDLRSSGKLGLIRNPDLRNAILEYYWEAETEDRRLMARRTGYPLASYELVPFRRSAEDMDEYATSADVEELVARLRRSELPSHILAETNRASFIRGSISRMHDQARMLITAIGSELRR